MSVPYTPIPSSKRFHIPPTLASDFDNFLQMDVPNQVMDFEVIRNWPDKAKSDYSPRYVRGELYPDSTKSRYEDTDNNMNIRFSVSADVDKGDIVIDENGRVYVLDWGINPEHNNRASRAVVCNLKMNAYRWVDDQVDELGYVVVPAHNETIVQDTPINAYRYDGRPEFSIFAGVPGLVPNALTIMTVQYNEQTKNLRADDKFVWGTDEYVIIDINWVGYDFNTEHGTLKIQAKKTAGGAQ